MMKVKFKTSNAYIEGEYICDVVAAALKHNLSLREMKDKIVLFNPGKKVEFRVEEDFRDIGFNTRVLPGALATHKAEPINPKDYML